MSAQAARRRQTKNTAKNRRRGSFAAQTPPVELPAIDSTPVWRWLAAAVLVAAMAVAVYVNTCNNDFVTWDDTDYVTKNPLLRGSIGDVWGDLGAAFDDDPNSKPHEQYYPLVFTSFWIEYQLVELDPWLYHATQVALHAINAALLLLLLRQLGVGLFPAIFAAALFAVHPINVASVAWVTERKNTLSMLFMLIALWLYVTHCRRQRWWPYVISMVAFAAALLSKTAAVTLVPVLLITDWLLYRQWRLAAMARVVPFLVLGLVMVAVTAHVEALQSKSGQPLDPLLRLLVAAAALAHYVLKLVWPAQLLPIYPRWADTLAGAMSQPRYWISLIAVIVVLVLIWRYRRWLGPYVLWGLAVFLFGLFPMLGLKHFNFLQFSFVSDHFVYHAAPGLFLVVGLLLERWRTRSKHRSPSSDTQTAKQAIISPPGSTTSGRTWTTPSAWRTVIVAGVTLVILAACSWLAIEQNRVWATGETMWLYTLTGNPDCYPANANLANHYVRQGDFEAAYPRYCQAASILPTHVNSRWSAAHCARQLGRVAEALDWYDQAWQVAADTSRPRTAMVIRTEKAGYLHQLGRIEDAKSEYQQILQADPPPPNAQLVWQAIEEHWRMLNNKSPSDRLQRGAIASRESRCHT